MDILDMRLFLKNELKNHGISQEKIAFECDISRGAVMSYLNGKSTLPYWFVVKALKRCGKELKIVERAEE